jgi:hypothetical protein
MEGYFNVNALDCWLIPTQEYSPNYRERSANGAYDPVPVVAIDKDGARTIYPSIRTASRLTATDMGSIHKVLRGQKITAGGYKWEYETKGDA